MTDKEEAQSHQRLFKGHWFWPLIFLTSSLFILMNLAGLPVGSFGEKVTLYFTHHLGVESTVVACLLVAISAVRDLRPFDQPRGFIRWCTVALMIVCTSTLSSQVFKEQTFPLSGGTLGTLTSVYLDGAFGFLAPVINLLVFSLAFVSWGGMRVRLVLKQIAYHAAQSVVKTFVKAKQIVLSKNEELEIEDSEELGAQLIEEDEEIEQEYEDEDEESPRFQRKPFDINELVKKKPNKKKSKKEKAQASIEEIEEDSEDFQEQENEEFAEVTAEALQPEDDSDLQVEQQEAVVQDNPAAQLPTHPKKKKMRKKKKLPQINRAPGDYELPPIDLLETTEEDETTVEELQQINESAKALQEALKNFGLDVQVVGIQQGPVITQYELELAPGIKVSRVMNLQNDIAMALRARSVRILAPIPGKATVGVEVPNMRRHSVSLRELIEGGYSEIKGFDLPSFIGRNIFGEPVTFDVSRMPHLLMAGATGAGKSVGINCLVLSLLMTRSPDEVKLILVDPKQVELNFYKNVPHLVSPVVTDMKKVPGILDWAVRKMEERYDLLARVSVRDINSFNKLGEEKVRERLGLSDDDGDVVDTYMPRVVIIIDELADLMMLSSASKEVEANIQRLAQKSRAVGIHVILATQRPSVDVITGVIKANLPCRIAFMVNSATDSRTILDRKGAEALLGQGDLLFKDPSRSDLQRLQGAFVSEEEVKQVVDFWKVQGEPRYIEDLLNPNKTEALDPREKDELYEKAVRLVLESRRGSTTFLQRMLGVGYTRASRLIEMMEMDGLVGPHKGSVSRDVLYTLEEYENHLEQEAELEDDFDEDVDDMEMEDDLDENVYEQDDSSLVEEEEQEDTQWQENPQS